MSALTGHTAGSSFAHELRTPEQRLRLQDEMISMMCFAVLLFVAVMFMISGRCSCALRLGSELTWTCRRSAFLAFKDRILMAFRHGIMMPIQYMFIWCHACLEIFLGSHLGIPSLQTSGSLTRLIRLRDGEETCLLMFASANFHRFVVCCIPKLIKV